MAQPRIVFEPYANGTQRAVVEEIVNRRNIAITGYDQLYSVAFFVKADDGEVLGGLLGAIWAKRLYVSILAVQEPFRGKGYGTDLMNRAEHYAIERRCTDSWLSTFSFQARPFYEQLGYRLFGTLDNYPDSHSLFFMTKHLVP